MSPRLTSFLDVSRWVAAFIVILGHSSRVVFAGRTLLVHPSPLTKALYALTNFGHEAVMVFFVISGFLVGGASLEKIRAGRFSLGDYAASRFSRIYMVLAPALLVGGALDLIGARLADASGVYSTIRPLQIESLQFADSILDRLNWSGFLGNLFMLEGIGVEQLGSNGPLWSLAYEWWYYCIFAAAVVAWTFRGPARLAGGAAAVLMILLLPLKITLWGLIWMLGMAASLYVRSKRKTPPLWAGAAACALFVGIGKALHHFETPDALGLAFAGDLASGLGFTALLLSCATGERPAPGAGFHRRAAEFSYSVYLVHYPFMLLCVALAHDYLSVPLAAQPSPAGLLVLGVLLAVVLAYCYGFSRAFEAQTPKLKAMLLRRRAQPLAIAAE